MYNNSFPRIQIRSSYITRRVKLDSQHLGAVTQRNVGTFGILLCKVAILRVLLWMLNIEPRLEISEGWVHRRALCPSF